MHERFVFHDVGKKDAACARVETDPPGDFCHADKGGAPQGAVREDRRIVVSLSNGPDLPKKCSDPGIASPLVKNQDFIDGRVIRQNRRGLRYDEEVDLGKWEGLP